MRRLLAILVALVATSPAYGAASPPANPFTGPTGTAAMHGDSSASDTSPLPGPGTEAVDVRHVPLAGACPSILIGKDGLPVALCTQIADRVPTAYVLDPATGSPLASLRLQKGDLFSGVYPYLDHHDRLVFADGSGDLLRIAHSQTAAGGWRLEVVQRTPLFEGCRECGSVVGLSPDWRGRVWFATDEGFAGVVRRNGTVRTRRLGDDESVANSIATAPGGTAIATDHALYLLRAGRAGRPIVRWRRAYDRGPARKPGQLSHGTGSTPTFFGPRTGSEYLAIVDNAAPTERLRVFTVDRGRSVCRTPVLTAGTSGSENSPIGFGRSVVVAGTFGYPYPALPDDAGPSEPASAPFSGGMTRVDINRGRCEVSWKNDDVRSAAVPKLSLAEGLIYTMERRSLTGEESTGPLDTYDLVALDFATGAVMGRATVGATTADDTLQLAGNTGPGRVLWQGTITGLLRIAPAG